MLGLSASCPCQADVFLLRDGGRVEGVEVSRDDKLIHVRTAVTEIALPIEQVVSIEKAVTVLGTFTKMKADCPATADGHFRLAMWCREHSLAEQARQELLAALAIDPAYADAHLALGHVKLGGIWLEGGDKTAASRPDASAAIPNLTPPAGKAAVKPEAAAEAAARFAVAVQFHQANNTIKFGWALGEVVKIDPNHVAARNDLAVLAANQQQWGTAFNNLAKAMAGSDSDVILDNYDLVLELAKRDASAGPLLADGYRLVQAAVGRLHAAGKHVGQGRWGNSWLAEKEIVRLVTENAAIDARVAECQRLVTKLNKQYKATQIAVAGLRWRATQAYNVDDYVSGDAWTLDANLAEMELANLEMQIASLTQEAEAAVKRKHIAPHADKLVFISPDGKAMN